MFNGNLNTHHVFWLAYILRILIRYLDVDFSVFIARKVRKELASEQKIENMHIMASDVLYYFSIIESIPFVKGPHPSNVLIIIYMHLLQQMSLSLSFRGCFLDQCGNIQHHSPSYSLFALFDNHLEPILFLTTYWLHVWQKYVTVLFFYFL